MAVMRTMALAFIAPEDKGRLCKDGLFSCCKVSFFLRYIGFAAPVIIGVLTKALARTSGIAVSTMKAFFLYWFIWFKGKCRLSEEMYRRDSTAVHRPQRDTRQFSVNNGVLQDGNRQSGSMPLHFLLLPGYRERGKLRQSGSLAGAVPGGNVRPPGLLPAGRCLLAFSAEAVGMVRCLLP